MSALKKYLSSLRINFRVKKAYERLFDSEDGQIVLGDLKNQFNYYTTSGTVDPNEALKENSERAVILHIMSMAKQFTERDIEAINKALKE